MKKIVASVGLVAIGASGLQTVSAQMLGAPDTSKPWSVSATLRGFYDDNTATLPNSVSDQAVQQALGTHKDSFGFEISPSAALVWSAGPTSANLGLLYSYKYYDNKPPGSSGHHDQSFTFNAGLNHSFSEQVHARVSDSFVVGQEPDLLRAGNTFSTFQRVSGDNIRNYGSLGLDYQMTSTFGLGVGYDNAFYDYKDATISGALDRIEHRGHVEGTYQLQPETKAIVGYQYTEFDYTASQIVPGLPISSDIRNFRQHTGYLGLSHDFSPELHAEVRAGGSWADYYNSPNADSTVTPYVNATVRYTYAPESYVQGGFTYDRSATDILGNLTGVTLDAESAVVFASINHRIMPNLFGSLLGQFQNSSYHGGAANNQDEQYYLLGLDLEYRFNQYFSAHVGYNYDRLESNSALARTFDRNRVYLGVTATY